MFDIILARGSRVRPSWRGCGVFLARALYGLLVGNSSRRAVQTVTTTTTTVTHTVTYGFTIRSTPQHSKGPVIREVREAIGDGRLYIPAPKERQW